MGASKIKDQLLNRNLPLVAIIDINNIKSSGQNVPIVDSHYPFPVCSHYLIITFNVYKNDEDFPDWKLVLLSSKGLT